MWIFQGLGRSAAPSYSNHQDVTTHPEFGQAVEIWHNGERLYQNPDNPTKNVQGRTALDLPWTDIRQKVKPSMPSQPVAGENALVTTITPRPPAKDPVTNDPLYRFDVNAVLSYPEVFQVYTNAYRRPPKGTTIPSLETNSTRNTVTTNFDVDFQYSLVITTPRVVMQPHAGPLNDHEALQGGQDRITPELNLYPPYAMPDGKQLSLVDYYKSIGIFYWSVLGSEIPLAQREVWDGAQPDPNRLLASNVTIHTATIFFEPPKVEAGESKGHFYLATPWITMDGGKDTRLELYQKRGPNNTVELFEMDAAGNPVGNPIGRAWETRRGIAWGIPTMRISITEAHMKEILSRESLSTYSVDVKTGKDGKVIFGPGFLPLTPGLYTSSATGLYFDGQHVDEKSGKTEKQLALEDAQNKGQLQKVRFTVLDKNNQPLPTESIEISPGEYEVRLSGRNGPNDWIFRVKNPGQNAIIETNPNAPLKQPTLRQRLAELEGPMVPFNLKGVRPTRYQSSGMA